MFDLVVMCALIDRRLLHLSSLGGGRNITSAGRNQQMGKAKDIKRYYCKRCQTQNPKLVIVHKSKYKDDKDYHRKRENRREEKKRKREERHKKEAEAEAKGTENSSC